MAIIPLTYDSMTGNFSGDIPTVNVNITPIKQTYSAAIIGLVAAASPTDIFTITGSATKIIKLARIVFSATATAETTYSAILLKRSTANSAGASTTLTPVAHDSTNPASTTVVRAYTANPTLGTLVGNVLAMKVIAPAVAPGQPGYILTVLDAAVLGQQFTLRGTSEVLAFNLNGVTIAGNNFHIAAEWTEE